MILEIIEPLIASPRKRNLKLFGQKIRGILATKIVLDIESIKITADPSSIVAFSMTIQILTIPQSQLLARAHRVRRKRGRITSGESELNPDNSEIFPGCLRNGLSGVIMAPPKVVMTTPT